MSRLLFLWALGPIISALAAARAFAFAVFERVAEVWPIAFPAIASMYRGQGVRLSREDAKPLARRIREYRFRVIAREATPHLPRIVAA